MNKNFRNMAADEIEYFRREIIECTRDCRRAEFTDVYQTESDHLSDRQRRATAFVKASGRITNKDYRELTGVITRTASRDLDGLVIKGVLSKVGTTGRSTYYVLAGKADKKKTNRT